MENKVKTIIISYKDRFIIFGYDWFERFLSKFEVNFIIVNKESFYLKDELVQGIIDIFNIFSCIIYGLRKYKNKIRKDEEVEKSIQNRN